MAFELFWAICKFLQFSSLSVSYFFHPKNKKQIYHYVHFIYISAIVFMLKFLKKSQSFLRISAYLSILRNTSFV